MSRAHEPLRICCPYKVGITKSSSRVRCTAQSNTAPDNGESDRLNFSMGGFTLEPSNRTLNAQYPRGFFQRLVLFQSLISGLERVVKGMVEYLRFPYEQQSIGEPKPASGSSSGRLLRPPDVGRYPTSREGRTVRQPGEITGTNALPTRTQLKPESEAPMLVVGFHSSRRQSR